jgi:hypothetical protein
MCVGKVRGITLPVGDTSWPVLPTQTCDSVHKACGRELTEVVPPERGVEAATVKLGRSGANHNSDLKDARMTDHSIPVCGVRKGSDAWAAHGERSKQQAVSEHTTSGAARLIAHGFIITMTTLRLSTSLPFRANMQTS